MRDRLIELFYDNNVHCDQKIEELADDVMDTITESVTVQEDCKACAEATQNCIVKLQEQIAELRSAQEWVSVKDRLPEKYRDEYGELIPFLVCESGTEYPCRALFDGKKWGDGVFPINVTHWMPLPPAPKGE